MASVFESKLDAWIVAVIWAGALLCGIGAVAQFTSAAPFLLRIAVLIFLGSAAFFMLWVLYSTEDALTDENLLIRCGPFRYRVPLDEIDSVTPSRNPLSSPAGPLDRLLIKWNTEHKHNLISPLRRTEFLKELNRRCDQLTLAGDSLSRNLAWRLMTRDCRPLPKPCRR